jgi:hypothetical protein
MEAVTGAGPAVDVDEVGARVVLEPVGDGVQVALVDRAEGAGEG